MGKKETGLVISQGDPTQLRETQIRFLEALEQNLGIVSKAADACGMSRQAHYEWLSGAVYPEAQPLYAAKVQEIEEITNDIIENAILEKVLEGDTDMIKFAAMCRLKKRGYGREGVFGNESESPGGGNTFILQILPPTIIIEQ